MNGNGTGLLAMVRKFENKSSSEEDADMLWWRWGDHEDVWRLGRVSLDAPEEKRATEFRLFFQLFRETNTETDYHYAALDDMAVLGDEDACGSPDFCDFEYDQCGWTNAVNGRDDDIDWMRNSGITRTPLTGPSVDHTLGTEFGWYMFIDTSSETAAAAERNASRKNRVAWLVSEHVQPNGSHVFLNWGNQKYEPTQYCVQFFYHMYGAEEMGPLSVLTRVESEEPQVAWRRRGNNGDVWLSDEFDVSETREFVVIFEAVHGVGVTRGDIAIDDIAIWPRKCHARTTTTSEPTTKGSDEDDVPAGYQHQLPLSCDFETDLCGWQASSLPISWLRSSGAKLNDLSGPLLDHTTGRANGHYLYVESAAGHFENDTARLVSAPFTLQSLRTAGVCFRFWYHMFGSSDTTLQVELENTVNHKVRTEFPIILNEIILLFKLKLEKLVNRE